MAMVSTRALVAFLSVKSGLLGERGGSGTDDCRNTLICRNPWLQSLVERLVDDAETDLVRAATGAAAAALGSKAHAALVALAPTGRHSGVRETDQE